MIVTQAVDLGGVMRGLTGGEQVQSDSFVAFWKY